MADKLRTIVDCSWGLILLEVWHTGSAALLLKFKETIERLGYQFAIRIYIDAGHWLELGLDAPAVFFWRGHTWLERGGPHKWPSIRNLLDICKRYGVGIVPVVSTFHPGFPGDPAGGYNEERHTVDRETLADIWRTLHRDYGALITYGCIDNEPATGGGGYTTDEYKRRVFHERQVLERLGIIPIIHHSANSPVQDGHLAIGGPEHAFPRQRPSMSENWLRRGVLGSQYAAFVRICRQQGDVILIGLNFGASFITGRGLLWGGGLFNTTWLWQGGYWTPRTGLLVLEALKRDDLPATPPPPEDIMTADEIEDVLDQLDLAEQKQPPLERVREGTARRKEERSRTHTLRAAQMLREKLETQPPSG